MRVVALGYHDVVSSDGKEASGFSGVAAARYKLHPALFRAHLDAIAAIVHSAPVPLPAADSSNACRPCVLSFDDGGVSALATADFLEQRSWRGHFFIPTGFLGSPGFLTGGQLRELARRGHMVGSHSVSHPARMWTMSWHALVSEWRCSLETLAELLGTAVTSASVPGGFYAKRVARAAAVAGVRHLFTSEPITRVATIAGCRVYGRYGVRATTTAAQVAALVAGRRGPAVRQWIGWQAKKSAKLLAGRLYERLGNVSSAASGDVGKVPARL